MPVVECLSASEVEAAAAAAADTGCHRFVSAIVTVVKIVSSEAVVEERSFVVVAEVATEDTAEEVAKSEVPMRDGLCCGNCANV